MKHDLMSEGEPSKRYGVSHGGEVIGSYDTAAEAFEAQRKHRELIRPVTDRKRQYDYRFRDGRKEITIEALRAAAKARDQGEDDRPRK